MAVVNKKKLPDNESYRRTQPEHSKHWLDLGKLPEKKIILGNIKKFVPTDPGTNNSDQGTSNSEWWPYVVYNFDTKRIQATPLTPQPYLNLKPTPYFMYIPNKIMLHCKDLEVTDILAYGTNTTKLRDGVIFRDRECYDPNSQTGHVKVRIFISAFGARPLQGLLKEVKQMKYGWIKLLINERQVNITDGFYTDECSDHQLEIITHSIDVPFLEFGWAKEQGNTAGMPKTLPKCITNKDPSPINMNANFHTVPSKLEKDPLWVPHETTFERWRTLYSKKLSNCCWFCAMEVAIGG